MDRDRVEELADIIRENTRPATAQERRPECIVKNLYLSVVTVASVDQLEAFAEKLRSLLQS